MRKPTRTEQLYQEAHGHQTLQRQRELAEAYYPCCGEHRDTGHHQECSKRPEIVLPAVIDGQESLA